MEEVLELPQERVGRGCEEERGAGGESERGALARSKKVPKTLLRLLLTPERGVISERVGGEERDRCTRTDRHRRSEEMT